MHTIWVLAFVTFAIVLIGGVYQWRSVRGSQAKRGEQPGETKMQRHASREAPDTEASHESGAAASSSNPRITHPDAREVRSPQEIRASLDAARAPIRSPTNAG